MKNYLSISKKGTDTMLMDENALKIDTVNIKKASLILRAVNHRLRCEILQLINQEEFINVTDIYSKMGLEQTVVSQHLAILRQAGYVLTQREGKCIFYSINHQRLNEVHSLVRQLNDK
jgi:DNA-binding transcriptional ArsR family regulator